jgi:hypothetical protein
VRDLDRQVLGNLRDITDRRAGRKPEDIGEETAEDEDDKEKENAKDDAKKKA